MKRIFLFLILAILMAIPSTFAADPKGVNLKPKTTQEWQTYLRYRRDETLEDLYKLKPEAKQVVDKAYGYGVFSNFGMKILVVGTGNGRGILHDNKSGKDTFMRMFQAGLGLGMGAKDFRAVFVFDDSKVMDEFLTSGWSFGSEANAAAKAEKDGAATSGAIAIAPGVRVYQLTQNGLMLDVMLNGTKYWVDKAVNE
jgi:lipid-binding SYLF domain-containing protein